MNTEPALGTDELNFNGADTWKLQVNGQAQAADAIAAGAGVGAQALKDWHANTDAIQDKFKNFGHYYTEMVKNN